MTTLPLPAPPRHVPELRAEPATVRTFAAALLAASAQVDDLGGFVGGRARVGDWTGLAADAYHRSVRPTGERADAMSLALRHVARRSDAHAETLQRLLARRATLLEEQAALVRRIADLRTRAAALVPGDPAALSTLVAACLDCRRAVAAYESDLERWSGDVATEERAMAAALSRLTSLERVEQRYAGVPDPADRALRRAPSPGSPPLAVHRWWTALTRAQQLAVLAASPGSVGNLDGIPAWARDAANTVSLDRDLAEWSLLEQRGVISETERRWLENARCAEQALHHVREADDPLTGAPLDPHLYLYDPTAFDGDGAVAISVGDLSAADDVAVVVPGLGSDAGSADYQADRAVDVYQSARFLGHGGSVATMAWIGYDAPDNLPWDGSGWDGAGVVGESMATSGGNRLADLVDGLRASDDGSAAHLTVIGHSYGSTTLGHAAHDHALAVDDLVLVGSPGAGGDTHHAEDLGIGPHHVWAGANSRDPIANLGNHGWLSLATLGGGGLGDDPVEDDFGAVRFEAESTTRVDGHGLGSLGDHGKYFDPDTESLYNISQVVDGQYAQVLRAEPVTDPWWTTPQDPEWDRAPTSPATGAGR